MLASTPLNDTTKNKLNELGKVKYVPIPFISPQDLIPNRYICGADAVHHLYLAEYKRAYPDAKLIGVAALVTKRKDLKFDGGTLPRISRVVRF